MSDEALEKELADVHELLQHGWEDKGTEHPEGVESVVQKYGLDRGRELIVAFVQAESWSLYDRTNWIMEQYDLETIEQLRQFDVDWEPIVLQWVSGADDPYPWVYWQRLAPEIDSAAEFKALFRSNILNDCGHSDHLEYFPTPNGDSDEVADLLAEFLNSPDSILAERACNYVGASLEEFGGHDYGFAEGSRPNVTLLTAIFAAIERRALSVWDGLQFLNGGRMGCPSLRPGPFREAYIARLTALRAHPAVSEEPNEAVDRGAAEPGLLFELIDEILEDAKRG